MPPPILEKISPSYILIEEGKDNYVMGIHGRNFDSRWLKCTMNDKIEL